MRLSPRLFPELNLLAVIFLALITISVGAAGQSTPPPPALPPPASDWVPQEIASLGQYATSRTEFTLDHSMLVLASKADQDDDDLRRVIAGVNGVSVHSFKYARPGMYDPETVNAVRHEYHNAGWMHLVGKHDKNGGPGATDLWVRMEHNTVSNIAVLFAGENKLNFISVSGSISPIDLLHLAGHFGIPKVEGGVPVPAPDQDR